MNVVREGGYVAPEAERARARTSLRVVTVPPALTMIGNTPIAGGLGAFLPREFSAARDLAEVLADLSATVADQEPDTLDPLELTDSLALDPETTRAALTRLRSIGAPLRAELPDSAVAAFQSGGFLDPEAEEPALVFLDAERPPPPWEFLYEGNQRGDPDWRLFWGLRVPITHCPTENRTAEIAVRSRVFAAASEDLRFAGQEVALLSELGLPVAQTLAEALRAHVHNRLVGERSLENDAAAAWFDADAATWLARYLDEFQLRQRADSETQDFLIDMLDHRYDLLHFACHCDASDGSQFLSRLELTIGGERVVLDVSRLATDLRQETRSHARHGPLVFLNACGTAQQGAAYEPPGFPEKWIKNKAAPAVIATLCPVPDYFAHAFARKFYEVLFEGISGEDPARNNFIAEALLSTRRHFMKEYGNPLGLAYVAYAVEDVHVRADFFGAKEQ